MRTIIFGGKGQLGRDLLITFGEEGPVLGLDLPELDIADADAVREAVAGFGPDLVVNAAAYTDVEKAEDDRAGAFRTNEEGAGVIARAAGELPVVYFSTDFVFDGRKTEPYEPEDAIAPLGVYAESKAAGEAAVRAANPRHFILRTAWLYGPGGNHFVEKILRAAAKYPELQVVENEVGSPTHTWDLAEATVALSKGEAFGTYHAVNAGACSRYEFAQVILALGGMKTPVRPCDASVYPSKARRPAYSVLSTEKLEKASGYRMRPWREALDAYFERRESSE